MHTTVLYVEDVTLTVALIASKNTSHHCMCTHWSELTLMLSIHNSQGAGDVTTVAHFIWVLMIINHGIVRYVTLTSAIVV